MELRRIVRGMALAAAAAAVGRASASPDGRAIDRELFEVANAEGRPGLERVSFAMTELGSLYAAGGAAAALLVTGRRSAAVRAIGAAGLTWTLLQGIKKVARRPRPYEADPVGARRLIAEPNGTSWPSSHPAVLTTFGRVAARELGVGAAGRAALSAVDASVALSRVVLGVHYPSDVVSGLLIGRAVAALWPGRRRTRG
jgi:membrane-associated phospholipid phosphatase